MQHLADLGFQLLDDDVQTQFRMLIDIVVNVHIQLDRLSPSDHLIQVVVFSADTGPESLQIREAGKTVTLCGLMLDEQGVASSLSNAYRVCLG